MRELRSVFVQILGCGSNEFGQLGHTAVKFVPNPEMLKDEDGKSVTGWDISAGNKCTVIVADTPVYKKSTPATSPTSSNTPKDFPVAETNLWDPQILYLGLLGK